MTLKRVTKINSYDKHLQACWVHTTSTHIGFVRCCYLLVFPRILLFYLFRRLNLLYVQEENAQYLRSNECFDFRFLFPDYIRIPLSRIAQRVQSKLTETEHVLHTDFIYYLLYLYVLLSKLYE